MRTWSVAAARACGLAAVLAVSGCGGTTAPAADSDDLTASAAFYPLQFVLTEVAGDDVRVELLTKPGTEPHDAELTAKQVTRLGEADLVVYLRGFQPAVDDAVKQAAPDRAFDVTSVVAAAAGSERDQAGDSSEHADEHGEEDAHGEHGDAAPAPGDAAHDDHGRHEGAADPHFWLDPTKLAAVATAVADRLGELDEQRAAGYDDRAAVLLRELEQLDRDYRAGLADCERREFVTNHAAFGHLAQRYDLEQIAISGLSPESEPSLSRVREVQELVREHGITTVFYEILVSPKTAETIAHDTGVRTAVLDPVEAITDDSPGRDYFSVMRANLAALREANGCR